LTYLNIFPMLKATKMNGRKSNSTLANFIKANPGLAVLKSGDLIEAILISKESKTAYFDLGPFGSGVVYGREFAKAASVLKTLEVGGKISAKIIDPENDNGYAELSLSEADAQKNWEVIKNLKESGEIITVKALGANSGGLIAEVNKIKAFIPVSQLSAEHYPKVDDGDRGKILEGLKKLVNQELKVKVMDFKPKSAKLILSERETVQDNSRELLNQYKAGDVVDGIISGVTDFGAFMKFTMNPKIEGLIHISELDHKLIENPKEIVKLDDAVKAKIIDIKDGRVSLSLKALKPDPWAKVEEKYKAGQEITGKVTRFNPFGAFIALDPEIQGLIHISEFGGSQEEMKKQLELGKSLQFKIEMLKPSEKRIILKLKK